MPRPAAALYVRTAAATVALLLAGCCLLLWTGPHSGERPLELLLRQLPPSREAARQQAAPRFMLSAWRSPSGAMGDTAIPTRRPLQQPQGGERAEQPAARAPSLPAWPPALLLAVAAVAVPLALNLAAGDPAAAQLLSPATASAASALPGLRGPRPAVRQAPAVADFWDPMVKLEVTRLQPVTPEAAKSLISDFSYTVYQNYYDAYDTGFSRDKWLRLIHD
eukprot:EG_transcript_26909